MRLVLLLALTTLMTPACSKRLEPTVTFESRDERMRLLRTALTVDHKPNQLHTIADETLSRLASAVAKDDFVAVADIVDLELMSRIMDARSATATKVAPSFSSSDARITYLRLFFSRTTLRWDTHTIRYVVPIGAASPVSSGAPADDVARIRELLVVATHRHSGGDVSHMRWWLIRPPDSPWKVYDYELSDTATRMSNDLPLLIVGALDKATWLKQVESVSQLDHHVGSGDFEAARRVVDRIDWRSLPVSVRAKYLLKRAELEEAEGHPETALATVDLAAGVHEDARTMRGLLVHRLSLLESLGRHKDVLATVAQIEALYGKDEIVSEYRTFAIEALETPPSPEPPQPTPR